MEFKYEIPTPSKIIIFMGEKSVTLSGESIFNPPAFYINSSVISNSDFPYSNIKVTEEDKLKIVNYLSGASAKSEVKVYFE